MAYISMWEIEHPDRWSVWDREANMWPIEREINTSSHHMGKVIYVAMVL